jgi:protein TonB
MLGLMLALANEPVHMRVVSDPATWVSSADYPPVLAKAGVSGITEFKLTVDATGTVTGCEIVVSSGVSALDTQTCELMSIRARFLPGRDAQGEPAGGTYRAKFRWVLPKKPQR